MATKCSIPVIDFLHFPNQTSKLISACQDWGCFRLLNFQQVLPASLMLEMKSVVRSLFDLPEDIKRRNLHVIPGSGYWPPNPLNEALGLYDMASQRDVDNFCSQLNATPHQRDAIGKYAKAVHELFVGIMEKIVEGLELKSGNIKIQNWPCHVRINKYHFTPEKVGTLGLQTQTDSGFLSILQEDEDVGGLEVMDKSGEFISVRPWPDTLIVNLGDMANVWSNGRFCNVKHRVKCKEAKIRVSIASFLLGPRDTLEPLKELVDDNNPRVYVPTTYEEYRKLRYSTKWHAGEALALLHTQASRGSFLHKQASRSDGPQLVHS